MDLVILCGGRGTRLKKITKYVPKPLLKIEKTSFLKIIINFYQKYNFNKIYLLAGFKGNKIKKEFHNKYFNSIKCEVLIEKKLQGTGGSLLKLKKKIKNNFLLVNGDSYINYDLLEFLKPHKNNDYKILLAKNKNYKENSKLINLDLDSNKNLIFKKKTNKFNAGVYLLSNKIFRYIKKNCSLENNVIANLIYKKKIKGQLTSGYFIDIGIKKNLILARKTLKDEIKKPAIFFDRDGVLNHDYGYVGTYERYKWSNNAVNALKFINKNNYYIFIVTNQSGIGRGYYSEKDFHNLNYKIKKYLQKKGIFINDILFCPHHPLKAKGKYKIKCNCRKPNIGMINIIKKNWVIDLKRSFFIGDKKSDLNTAKKSNIKFYYAQKNLLKQIGKLI